jgi:hypothetical protein
VANTNLAGAGLAHADLNQLELLGAAVLVDLNGAGGMFSHGGRRLKLMEALWCHELGWLGTDPPISAKAP